MKASVSSSRWDIFVWLCYSALVGFVFGIATGGCAEVYRVSEKAQQPCVAICDDAIEGLSAARRVSDSECRCSTLHPWRPAGLATVDVVYWEREGQAPAWLPRRIDAFGWETQTVEFNGTTCTGGKCYRYQVR